MKTVHSIGVFGIFVFSALIAGCGGGSGSSHQNDQVTNNSQVTRPGQLKIQFSSVGAIDVRNLVVAQLNNALNPQVAASPLPDALAGIAGVGSLQDYGNVNQANPDPAATVNGLSITLLFDPTTAGGETCLQDANIGLIEGTTALIEGTGVVTPLGFSWLDVFQGNSYDGASMQTNLLNLWQQEVDATPTKGGGPNFTSANIGVVITQLTHCSATSTSSDGSSGGVGTVSWDLTSNQSS